MTRAFESGALQGGPLLPVLDLALRFNHGVSFSLLAQQSALGSHGHDMHPQEFVRLSGCQQLGVRERLAAELRH